MDTGLFFHPYIYLGQWRDPCLKHNAKITTPNPPRLPINNWNIIAASSSFHPAVISSFSPWFAYPITFTCYYISMNEREYILRASDTERKHMINKARERITWYYTHSLPQAATQLNPQPCQMPRALVIAKKQRVKSPLLILSLGICSPC